MIRIFSSYLKGEPSPPILQPNADRWECSYENTNTARIHLLSYTTGQTHPLAAASDPPELTVPHSDNWQIAALQICAGLIDVMYPTGGFGDYTWVLTGSAAPVNL